MTNSTGPRPYARSKDEKSPRSNTQANRKRSGAKTVLAAVERWKECTLATFGWLTLVIAIVVVLIIEMAAVRRVWAEMFFPVPSSSSPAKAVNQGGTSNGAR